MELTRRRCVLGNASAEAFDAIGLDTAKPIALATQDRFTNPGGRRAAKLEGANDPLESGP